MNEEAATVTTTDDAATTSQPDNKIIQVTGPETDAAAKAAEDAATAAAKAKEAEPEKKIEKIPAWIQRRWDDSALAERIAKREAKRLAGEKEALEATLEALRKGTKTEDGTAAGTDTVPKAEFDRRVAEESERLAKADREAQSAAAAQRQFDTDSNSAYEAGKKAFGDEFDSALQNIGRLGVDRNMLEVAYATDAPAIVLFELGRDPAKAERILALSPAKMAVEFAKLALQAPKTAKTVSSAPAPSRPLSGTAQVSGEPRDEDGDADWFAKRRAQKAKLAAAGR